jgi:hypothetical protein
MLFHSLRSVPVTAGVKPPHYDWRYDGGDHELFIGPVERSQFNHDLAFLGINIFNLGDSTSAFTVGMT